MPVIQSAGGGGSPTPKVIPPTTPTLFQQALNLNPMRLANQPTPANPVQVQTSLQSINQTNGFQISSLSPMQQVNQPKIIPPSNLSVMQRANLSPLVPLSPPVGPKAPTDPFAYLRSVTGGGTDNFKGSAGLDYGNAMNFVVNKYVQTGDQSYMPGQITLQELPTLQQQMGWGPAELQALGYINAGPAGWVKPPGGLAGGSGGTTGTGSSRRYYGGRSGGSGSAGIGGPNFGLISWRILGG